MKALLIFALALEPMLVSADAEITTETKPGVPVTAPAGKPTKPLDPKLRAAIRKAAPFWIEDNAHGAPIRIAKDGTFTSEAQGGGSTAGRWRALKGGILQIQWKDAGDEFDYKVESSGGALKIQGQKAKNGRFKLSGR
ncbi:MAG TPA: hypothetical protein PKC28_08715 [Bdellovibrionales bacterium]|nr:hypothetical protein [Bdellovibrionales bacterium]